MIRGSATLERARSLADEQCWAIALQVRRLRSVEPEDTEFLFRRAVDFNFLLVSLTRLRKAAKLAATVRECSEHIEEAIAQFDAALPGLLRMRNVAEHMDDYGIDHPTKRRADPPVTRQMLQVASWDSETYIWLGESLHAPTALEVATTLYRAIRLARDGYQDPDNSQ